MHTTRRSQAHDRAHSSTFSNTEEPSDPVAGGGYSIGVVSRLTGIQPSTLRMWERRYRVTQPARSSGGNRRYSDDDVQRLVLLKMLVDGGHQIGSVAAMPVTQLKARIAATSPQSLRASGTLERCRVSAVGATLIGRLSGDEPATHGIDVVGLFADEAALLGQADALEVDVLLLEFASLHDGALGAVRRLMSACGARRAVVVFGFGTRQALTDLVAAGVVCLRAPANVAEISRAARSLVSGNDAGGSRVEASRENTAPAPRFSSDQLARISAMAPAIACECPHHLVDLISGLTAFEAYSQECQSRNAEDARIHAMLSATAARGRAMLEAALERVAEYEGISLD